MLQSKHCSAAECVAAAAVLQPGDEMRHCSLLCCDATVMLCIRAEQNRHVLQDASGEIQQNTISDAIICQESNTAAATAAAAGAMSLTAETCCLLLSVSSNFPSML